MNERKTQASISLAHSKAPPGSHLPSTQGTVPEDAPAPRCSMSRPKAAGRYQVCPGCREGGGEGEEGAGGRKRGGERERGREQGLCSWGRPQAALRGAGLHSVPTPGPRPPVGEPQCHAERKDSASCTRDSVAVLPHKQRRAVRSKAPEAPAPSSSTGAAIGAPVRGTNRAPPSGAHAHDSPRTS